MRLPMGIYDSLPMLGWTAQTQQRALLVLAGIAVVGILLLLFTNVQETGFGFLDFLQPNPIDVQLSGPIDLSIGPDGFPKNTNAELTVTLRNPESKPVSNAVIHVIPEDTQSLIVYPASKTIATLDKTRTTLFTIRTNPVRDILSGTYKLQVRAFVGTKTYSREIELEVKTNET